MYSSTYYVKELRTMISLHRILICTGFPVVSYLRVGILHMHATLLILDIVGVFNNVNHGAGRCIWIRPYFEGENLDACHFPHSSATLCSSEGRNKQSPVSILCR